MKIEMIFSFFDISLYISVSVSLSVLGEGGSCYSFFGKLCHKFLCQNFYHLLSTTFQASTKCFTWIISLNPHKTPMRNVFLLYSL